MKLSIQLKLLPDAFQASALTYTLETANAACNYISQTAWNTSTFGKFQLQPLVYQPVRETFGLGAQLAVRCIAKVADAYKLNRTKERTFRPTAAIAYDDRILSWNVKGQSVSIWTHSGRLSIPFVCGERQKILLDYRQGETDLCFVRGKWYLVATCDIDEPEPIDVEGFLGVDLGIVNLATDSDGDIHSGAAVEARRQWYAGRRGALQAVGTKNAKRRLCQLKGRQKRLQKNTNHVISKRLVAKAEHTKRALVLEDLTHIRKRVRVKGAEQRARHSNWSFFQLRFFIAYKAALWGVPVWIVNPAYTSQRCSVCGHTERRNRRSQAEFCCVVCQFATLADYNAARNIEWAACLTAYGGQPTG